MIKHPDNNCCSGFSLIEVLIALLVLSIGLLGLALLQVTALQANNDSYFRTQATLYASEIADRMRANAAAVTAGSYHVPDTTAANAKKSTYDACKTGGACACHTAGIICDTANLAIYDLGKWYEEQQRVLPQGGERSTITRNGNQHTIVIRWVERELSMTQEWVVEL